MNLNTTQSSKQDSQFVEIVGRHYLITQLMRAGIEIAEPVRDRGIDLVAYIDSGSAIGRFLARPIQLKANWQTGFAFDRKYDKFHDLIVAYVWNLDDPTRTVTYALTWPEICGLAGEFGWAWETGGRWAITSPSKRLISRLEAFRMSPEKWWTKITGTDPR